MSTVAIIQARQGGRRLPGKVLMPLSDGRPALVHVVERVMAAKSLKLAVVACPAADHPVLQGVLTEMPRTHVGLAVVGIPGDEQDVLRRFYEALRTADYLIGQSVTRVVRITADCPFTDPDLIDTAVERLSGPVDYVSNVWPAPTYPAGLDVEAFTATALIAAHRAAERPEDREHVTGHIRRFSTIATLPPDPALTVPWWDTWTNWWSLDTAEDLARIRAIGAAMVPGAGFGWRATLDAARKAGAFTPPPAEVPPLSEDSVR